MSNIINLHLSTDGAPVQALAVPAEDTRRLTYYPLKWLRYVSLAIFGATGHLSLTANSPVIDNKNTPLEELVTDYYYVPNCELHLIDHHALNDRVSSSYQAERSRDFRSMIMERDGDRCVFTDYPSVACQAAHLIPGSKDYEYIQAVYEQRIHLYPFSEMEITDKSSIDCAQNGIFLNAALRLFLGDGSMVLLRTPNFALQPENVPRVETGPMPPSRLTLQYLKSMDEYPVPPQKDARVTNSHIPPLSPLILDYIYGAAVYRRWAKNSSDIETMMQARSKQFYNLSRRHPSLHSSDNDMLDDDPNGPDYEPGQGTTKKCQKHDHTSREMLDAMDAIFVLSKLVRGSGTPPEIAEEREQRMKEAELREQEASRAKVDQWLHGRPVQST